MKRLSLVLIILSIISLFIGCNEDLAQQNQVKPAINENQIRSMGLIPMTELERGSIQLAVKPLRGVLPNSYDLSPYFPPVGSQDNQGSCAAWSSGYNYKSFQENFERGWGYSSYDHIMSPAFVYNYAHQGEQEYACNNAGMTLKEAADILKNVGIVSWSEMPYNDSVCSVGPTQTMINHAYKYRIDDYKRVEINDFKTFLASNMPIFFGGEIFENFGSCWSYSSCMDEYKNNGNVFKTLRGRSEGGHGMVIVGYNDQKQAFKIINSWGTSWGENGYLWVSYSVLRRMVQNYGSYGYVFIDHIEDPCENVDCGYHGECKVSPQKTAYCDCDNGYKADLLNCIQCNENSYKQCSNGSVYWYDSCGEKGSIVENCSGSCKNIGVDNASCVSNCESHSTQKCYDNGIYWYNSCGEKESLALDCGAKVCDDSIETPQCKATNLCENVNCPSNSECKVSSTNETACYCIAGYHVNSDSTACEADETQIDPCESVNCPRNSTCKNNNGDASCYCDEGYHVNNDASGCEADETQTDPCESVNCPSNSTCQVNNNEAGCYCNEGYYVENGACTKDVFVPEVCVGINCEQWYGNTVCIEYNGNAGCDCKEGYHWRGNDCVR